MPSRHVAYCALAGLLFCASAAPADEKESVRSITAVELTQKFKDDMSTKLLREYAGKKVEVEGEIRSSQKFATGEGWSIKLKGCEVQKDHEAVVIMSFEADNPDLAKAKKLTEGDKVTVRAEFLINYGASVGLRDPRIVKGSSDRAPTDRGPTDRTSADSSGDRKPEVKATAERFVKEAVADPRATQAKLKGKVVELTGTVSTADPTYSGWGFTLSAGKAKPADASGLFVECAVPEEQLEKVWLLAKDQKVKVVGVLTGIEKDRVRLAKCAVTELEPNPIPTVKAADLAAAYSRNEREASRKYGERYNLKEIFLEGTVKSTKEAQYGTLVFLDGSGKIAVRLQVDAKEAKALKVGDKVRLKSTCRGYWPEEKAVLLFGRVLKNPKEKD
jgi:hypothetical protein